MIPGTPPISHDTFFSVVVSTSDRLHCELVNISFVQTHREMDFPLFCKLQEVNMCNTTRTSSVSVALLSTPELKSKVKNILDKDTSIRINLNPKP